jgi:hypothetical protein
MKVSQAICFSNDSFGVGVDALEYPDYPEDPKCLGYPDGHEAAVATGFKPCFNGAVSVNETLLLHLAPSLIVFKQEYPEEFSEYGYQSALKEVFAFYESIMVDNKYWGFKGETFATGHILEHYAMDHREPKSLKALEYMIQQQSPNGKFNLGKNNFLGAQVHGIKGLHRSMQVFGFNY